MTRPQPDRGQVTRSCVCSAQRNRCRIGIFALALFSHATANTLAIDTPPGILAIAPPPPRSRLSDLAPAPHASGRIVVRYSLPPVAAAPNAGSPADRVHAFLLQRAQGEPVSRRPLIPPLPVGVSHGASRSHTDRTKQRRRRFALDRVDVFTVPHHLDVPALCAELLRRGDIEYAHPDYTYQLQFVPNDPFFASANSWGQGFDDLYGPRLLQCEQAWDLTQGDGVIVAVVDSGIDYTHPDLAANIWINSGEDINGSGAYENWSATEQREGIFGDNDGLDNDANGYIDDLVGYDFSGDGSNPDPDPRDTFGHGTHVAGTIAAVANNAVGIIGIAPRAKIMALKIGADNAASVSTVSATQALIYAVENGADVTNHSWGGFGSADLNPTLAAAFDFAADAGLVSVASAGNFNADAALVIPAGLASTIAVAATDHTDRKAPFSNFGLIVDLTAPGGGETGPPEVDLPSNSVLSLAGAGTILGNFDPLLVGTDYLRLAGTSMASPHVAGVVALIRSLHPTETPDDIRARLKVGADHIDNLNPDFTGLLGAGRVNALASLQAAPQPFLELVAAVPQGIVAPNRIFDLVVTIRNSWRRAADVRLILQSLHPLVETFPNVSDLGDLPAGQQTDNTASPFRITVDGSISFGELLPFELTIEHADGNAVLPFSIPIRLFQDILFETGLPSSGLSAITLRMQDGNDNAFPDILTTTLFRGARYYRNRRDGTFARRTLPTDVVSTLGLAMLDLDGDGLRDLLVPGNVSGQSEVIHAFRRIINHQFEFAPLTGDFQSSAPTVNLPFDYNRDGLADLMVFGGFRVRLFRNDGAFHFTEVTDQTLPEIQYGGQSFNDAVLADFDNDGLADVIATGGGGRGLLILRNRGDGTFENATPFAQLPFIDAQDLAVGDFDNDGWIDIFAGNFFGTGPANHLLHNNHDATFTDITADAGAINETDPQNRPSAFRGSDCFDFDNDGWLDIFLQCGDFNTQPKARLYRNTQTGAFTDQTAANITVPPGVRFTAALDDYDNDGDIDIYLSDSPFGSAGFLRNHATSVSNPNHYVRIRLRGTESDLDAFGARVTVRTGSLQQFRDVTAADLAALPLHFGLGNHDNIDEVTIRWPSGRIQRHPNQPVDTTLLFVEGDFRRGDADGDGDLDLFDFARFANCFGTESSDCLRRFDFDSNGLINLFDFATFAFAFGGSASLLIDAGPSHTIHVDRSAQFFEPAVNGGLPPYAYHWDPVENLTFPNSPTPIADPLQDTLYTLTVTDALGTQTQDSLLVRVLPMAVDAGDDTAMFSEEILALPPAQVLGGIPPYSYLWSPAAGLDRTDVPDPTANPGTTTDYTVVVTDSDDPPKTAQDTVRVLVDALYDLADMTEGFRGITILGADHRGSFGASCAGIGDLNEDRIDDILIGAPTADTTAPDTGAVYVIFGGDASVAPGIISVATLDPAVGFEIRGLLAGDFLGASVAGIGDVNGDNLPDFAIGATGVDAGATRTGAVYVVFGNATLGARGSLDLAALDGTNGFVIPGLGEQHRLGAAIARAGDFNQDNIDDFVIGATGATLSDDPVGAAYVLFGSAAIGAGGTFDLANLNGTNGFVFYGTAEGDRTGISLAAAGDFDGDLAPDLIIGADRVDRSVPSAIPGDPDLELFNVGAAYVVFGGVGVGGDDALGAFSVAGVAGVVHAADLTGPNGFVILGAKAFDFTGFSVAAPGDFNNDGAPDLALGAPFADQPKNLSGTAYIIYGGPGVGSAGLIDLIELTPAQGFAIFGEHAADLAGYVVAPAGDINADDISDLLISAPFEDTDVFNQGTGSTYVLFGGKGTGAAGTARLSDLIGPTGFRARGVSVIDGAGISVSAIGDFNDDDIDDLLIGADNAQTDFPDRPGAAYIIFGKVLPQPPSGDPIEESR